jgi:hypothetical protein
MEMNDFINGCLEFFSAILVLWNVRRLYIDKMVRGISLIPVIFFDTWGLWNIFYYASLDQWWSWTGGLFLVAANIWWTTLAIYYGGKNAKDQQGEAGSTIRLIAPGIHEASQEADG